MIVPHDDDFNTALQIEAILTEASAYGLREEVTMTAKMYISQDSDLDEAVAYEMGFQEWVK
tara:strand:- start:390 stop:572 length:183 start_codon:yes stop_codon:yes gene_type:complete